VRRALENAREVVAIRRASSRRPPDHTGTRRSLNILRLPQNRASGISASNGPAITSFVGEMNANLLLSGTRSQPSRIDAVAFTPNTDWLASPMNRSHHGIPTASASTLEPRIKTQELRSRERWLGPSWPDRKS